MSSVYFRLVARKICFLFRYLVVVYDSHALNNACFANFVATQIRRNGTKKNVKIRTQKIASKNCMIFLNVYDNRKCLSPSRVIQENHSRIYANMAAECLSLVCVCVCGVRGSLHVCVWSAGVGKNFHCHFAPSSFTRFLLPFY